jgi:hypothetical protein
VADKFARSHDCKNTGIFLGFEAKIDTASHSQTVKEPEGALTIEKKGVEIVGSGVRSASSGGN